MGPERGGGAGLASDAARADGGAKAGRTIGRSSADDHPIGGDTGNDDDDRSTTVTTLPRLLVNADLAGRMIGCSGRQWRRLWHRGLVPDPVVVGSRRLWSVAELSAWAVAGAPPRVKWLAMREARLGATG